jgi:hypothetical protein
MLAVGSHCTGVINVDEASKMEMELSLWMRDALIPMAVDANAFICVAMSPA